MPIYAVRKGKVRGLYTSRAKAKKAAGPGGEFRAFQSRTKAKAYMKIKKEPGPGPGPQPLFLGAIVEPSDPAEPLFLEAEGDITTLQDGTLIGGYTVRFGVA